MGRGGYLLLLPVLALPAVRAALGSSSCAGECTTYGTCNEQLQRCDCPVGRTGDDCSVVSMPACELIPGYTTPCSTHPTTCSCLKECYTAWGGESAIPGGRRVCYTTPPNAPPTSATDLTRMYTGAQARLHMNGGHMDLEALDDGDREKLGALPLEQCADACHLHGWCNERTQCTCFEGWNGPTCENSISVNCLSDCNGKGNCTNGFCHCEPGFWGVDCSVSKTSPDAPPESVRLWGSTRRAQRRPSIYIYDLPPVFDAWYLGYRAPDRALATQIHERLLSSEYRTPDPDDADFFLVPFDARMVGHFHDTQPKMLAVYDYIKTTWPFWNRKGGADHLQILVGDYGPADIFGYGANRVPELLESVVLLTHNGQFMRGQFRPGHDVVLPPIQSGATGFESKMSPLFGGVPQEERDTVLFFAGGVDNYDQHKTVRGYVLSEHKMRDNYLLLDHSIPDYRQRFASSIFCLAPPGKGNDGWGRRMSLAALYGCIPVIVADGWEQPLEELLPYEAFSVRVKEEDVPTLHDTLAGILAQPELVATMQRNLKCVAQRWLYSSIHGAYDEEDGTGDALESTLETLRRRLLVHGEPVLDAGLADGRVSAAQVEVRKAAVRLRPSQLCAATADVADAAAQRTCLQPRDVPLCSFGGSCKRVDAASTRPLMSWPAGGAACAGRDDGAKPCDLKLRCAQHLQAEGATAEAAAEAAMARDAALSAGAAKSRR